MVQISATVLIAALAASAAAAATPQDKLPFIAVERRICRSDTEKCVGTKEFCEKFQKGFKSPEECVAARELKRGELPFIPLPSVQCRMDTEFCVGTVMFCNQEGNRGYMSAADCLAARKNEDVVN
ncbi:hypothetical protein QQS21_003131 [Conoideocrella luteorostrata]|uniref:Uncharacterized protein n=1 Tax=Conoideocrella luteorostrata TaxID=1105319 RepID=A0AAJ0FWM4_9HYPO|nr:hypothetical protein QQS21_003131 [Conoideocrella luteorostrata]